MLADAFGKGNNLDIGAETLEFDIAAVLGRTVSRQSTAVTGYEERHQLLVDFLTVFLKANLN